MVTTPETSAAPSTRRGRLPFAMAMGGGGAFGIAFHLGVTRALIDAGAPVHEGPMIGISAGAYAAAALATGVGLDEIARAWAHADRTKERGLVRAAKITEQIFGEARDARVTGVGTAGLLPVRVRVGGARHPLSDVVAAASSPVGLAHPHVIDGRPLYDAGMYFNTAADLAPAADVLLVLAPLARRVPGWQGPMWETRLRCEVGGWRLRHGGQVVVVRPAPEVRAAGGRSLREYMSMRRAPATYRAAYEQGQQLAPEVLRVLGRARATRARAAGTRDTRAYRGFRAARTRDTRAYRGAGPWWGSSPC